MKVHFMVVLTSNFVPAQNLINVSDKLKTNRKKLREFYWKTPFYSAHGSLNLLSLNFELLQTNYT